MPPLFSFNFRYDDNEYETETSLAQFTVENSIGDQYMRYIDPDTLEHGGEIDDTQYRLSRPRHEQFLRDAIAEGSGLSKYMDALQPWLIFWSLNSLAILGSEIRPDLAERALESLRLMQDPSGGFGGGNRQIPHLADTYAAVMALTLLDSDRALEVVDRQKMHEWLVRLKRSDGSFYMHEGGEVDVRGIYCALTVASVLNIMTPEITANCADFIAGCQTCEGGIGPYPGVEAHGGYTLCGLAALEILGRSDIVDLKRLSRWMILRQMPFEGGFSGRANKLVDGCYSYWQGGSFVLLQKALK
ncbi:CAAX farnesyltransferase (FTase) subunit beta, partial [Linderina pennispora]